jgi:hypothetical protein
MSAKLTAMPRAVASALVLALAVMSSAECLAAAQAPVRHACCQSMNGDCEMAITSSCCSTEVTNAQGFVATKPIVGFIPAATLLAVLAPPAPVLPASPRAVFGRGSFAPSPPGVPTYLFVATFRI